MSKIKQLIEVKHPLVQHKLTLLRDKNTPKKLFRELVNEITLLLIYEASKDLPIHSKTIDTPLETFDAPILVDDSPVIVPILRAGLGMVEGFLSLMPDARVGHIGLYRDEDTHEPNAYYFKIPQHSSEQQYFVCDPMLATGGSAASAITQLKQHQIKKIIFVSIVSSPLGVETLAKKHPDVMIYTASVDRELNNNAYIVPGLGDAGDRLYGTQ